MHPKIRPGMLFFYGVFGFRPSIGPIEGDIQPMPYCAVSTPSCQNGALPTCPGARVCNLLGETAVNDGKCSWTKGKQLPDTSRAEVWRGLEARRHRSFSDAGWLRWSTLRLAMSVFLTHFFLNATCQRRIFSTLLGLEQGPAPCVICVILAQQQSTMNLVVFSDTLPLDQRSRANQNRVNPPKCPPNNPTQTVRLSGTSKMKN